MQLFLKLFNAPTTTLSADPESTVGDLKALVEELSCVPVSSMRLVADGKHSLDENTAVLSSFPGLCSGSTVSLLLRLRGGIDFQHREGSKFGSGGVMSETQAAADRRERLRKLALETIDLDKDPYFLKNHLGTFECKLCLTLHTTEGNYLAHTQGKRHQQNLARRAAREEQMGLAAKPQSGAAALASGKATIKIGRPGYKVTKSRDPVTGQRTLLFEVDYPEAEEGTQPRHRFMSAYEQRIEAPDKSYQYLQFACEPYETIGFKIPNDPIDKGEGRFFTSWDDANQKFTLQLYFMSPADVAALAQASSGAGGAPKRQIRAIAAGVLA
jgi:splicing factor 3A subunit 2